MDGDIVQLIQLVGGLTPIAANALQQMAQKGEKIDKQDVLIVLQADTNRAIQDLTAEMRGQRTKMEDVVSGITESIGEIRGEQKAQTKVLKLIKTSVEG